MNIWGNEGTEQKYRKEEGEAPLALRWSNEER